ncbi:MAG: mannose-1-phosphate guanylyltransferase/mannose-6-phosphate isomerase [Pseudomonadota bacterium]
MIIPVILAGGSGTRLWPLSRQHYPKQLLKLFGDSTMLQQTVLRLAGLPDLASPIVVCNVEHRFMVAEQLHEIGIKDAVIILEPIARNTAPALALAALQADATKSNPTLLVLSADHMISDVEAFHHAVKIAIKAAEKGRLVTFGVQPTHPETGYGYIKTQQTAADTEGSYRVEQFVEKPNEETAEQYLAAGCYYWNSGMFVFKTDVFLEELKNHSPEVVAAAEQSKNWAVCDLDFIRVHKDSFATAPNISIDYALMEKSVNVVCVPLAAGWSDVGDWKSFANISAKDDSGNSFIGDSIDVGSSNTLVFSRDKLVATLGVENLMIINTPDAILIADKSQAQHIKAIISQIEQQKRSEHMQHREIYRPWGCYDAIDDGERYQVNRIRVKPGASLSLQLHHHRAEHWIVVKGTALVQKGDEVLLLSENESTYIPVGIKHRLSNPGKIPLEIVEVQSGSYLEEDDVIRYEDSYGRS